MAENKTETHSFEAEVNQLLHLMIHSLYSNKEIFLRELVSNASDAIDRLRFESLTNEKLLEENTSLSIEVTSDEKEKTITITDNGVGMSKDEVIDNIGTIARSGTKQFLNSMSDQESPDTKLIGQFGVGFYSVFLVAKKVELRTRRAGSNTEDGIQWISDGSGEYTLENIEMPKHGTTIILHLKDEDIEFADDFRLKNIIERYSDHISFPILLEFPSQRPYDRLLLVPDQLSPFLFFPLWLFSHRPFLHL